MWRLVATALCIQQPLFKKKTKGRFIMEKKKDLSVPVLGRNLQLKAVVWLWVIVYDCHNNDLLCFICLTPRARLTVALRPLPVVVSPSNGLEAAEHR